MKTIVGLLIVSFAIALNWYFPKFQTDNVLAAEITPEEQPLQLQPIKTQSRFETKLIEDVTILPKKTVYKDNPEVEAGTDEVLEEGEDGKRIKIIAVTYYEGKEYERKVQATENIAAKDKVISRGTKIVWRTLDTADGQITYWKKIRVWATHYDSRCPGCNEWTAIGMRAGKGVIAVDPSVIKMRSRVYVPGYGLAVAGDTGGAIKGNIVDLGFDDARTAGWSARFVDIYLLN